jgi:hypothetical protein
MKKGQTVNGKIPIGGKDRIAWIGFLKWDPIRYTQGVWAVGALPCQET